MRHVLLSTSEMGEADRLTIENGTPGRILMDKAGRAVAHVVENVIKPPAKLLVACGPGNNGGDGFVAARVLAGRGFTVEVALLGTRSALRGDADEAAQLWADAVLSPQEVAPAAYDLIIDALFGAGLSRDLDRVAAAFVAAINASGKPVVAVDIPSGIDGNSGLERGVSIRADHSVTFFRKKPGHLLFPGRQRCGTIHVADIGIADQVLERIGPQVFSNDPALFDGVFVAPMMEGHKYNRGHAVVISGGLEHTGAARLAATAALRAGAGLVTVASPIDALVAHASALTAVMVRQVDDAPALAVFLEDERLNAVVIGPGCGVGQETRDKVASILSLNRAAVLDADALTSFSGDAEALARLISQSTDGVIITPHAGEFSRLFSAQTEIVNHPSRLEKARLAAQFLGAVVILKGPDTVIASPDGRAAINVNGTPWLATAGSGDVLAGILGGLLAQGHDVFSAACAGVWLHAACGEEAGAGLIAEDLHLVMPRVLGLVLANTKTE